MNYQKTVFTKMHLKDSNAAVGVLPINFDKEDTEFFEPIPIFYTAKELVDFEDGHYYTILKGEFDHSKIEKVKQEVIIYTETQILVFNRTKQSENFALEFEYAHDFGIPPCFRVGGIVVNTDPPQLFESFIAGVLPHWDDAVAMYSDLQAAIVNHLYPEKWEYTPECDNKECNGTGKVMRQNAKGDDIEVNCPDCSGTGRKASKGPFNIYQINKDALNPDAPLQIPPFGYGPKELESTELLEVLVEKEIKKGFEAINMDILNDVGENQSGVAKVIDRQDLDSFLFTYSSHVFKYVIPNTIFFITMWRYWILFNKNIETIKAYLPKIKEPTTFDIFSIQLLTEEYSKLAESGVGGTFLVGIQKDIIDKRFTDETTKNFYNTIIDVDPLAHLSLDEMMTQSRVIGPVEQTIHTYAKDLVEEAISINKDFLSLDLMDKKEIIRKLAEAKQPVTMPVEPIE